MLTLIVVAWISFSNGELADDPRVRRIFGEMLEEGRHGRRGERASFLVRSADGRIVPVAWPEGELDSVSWQGPPPVGAIAVVHTHPAWLTMPSRIDRCTSRRLGLPVYVLTPGAISKAHGRAGSWVVARGSWNDVGRQTARKY